MDNNQRPVDISDDDGDAQENVPMGVNPSRQQLDKLHAFFLKNDEDEIVKSEYINRWLKCVIEINEIGPAYHTEIEWRRIWNLLKYSEKVGGFFDNILADLDYAIQQRIPQPLADVVNSVVPLVSRSIQASDYPKPPKIPKLSDIIDEHPSEMKLASPQPAAKFYLAGPLEEFRIQHLIDPSQSSETALYPEPLSKLSENVDMQSPEKPFSIPQPIAKYYLRRPLSETWESARVQRSYEPSTPSETVDRSHVESLAQTSQTVEPKLSETDRMFSSAIAKQVNMEMLSIRSDMMRTHKIINEKLDVLLKSPPRQ